MNDESIGTSRSRLRRYAPLVVILLIMVVAWSSGVNSYLTLESLADNKEALTEWIVHNITLASLLLIAVYALATAASLPVGAVLTISAGFFFGVWLGGSLVVLGATLGASGIFIAAKSSVGEALAARAGTSIEKLRAGFREGEVSYMLFLRLVPAFPFWLVNIAPALLGVRLFTYVWTTAVGIIPGTFAFAFFGSALGGTIDDRQAARQECIRASGDSAQCPLEVDYGSILTPELIAGMLALALVACIPMIVKKIKARRGAQ